MNVSSMDYLSSNLNHVYSLIKENLSTTSNYLSALVKKNLSPILNDQQQRIALIAAGVLASLVASYALYRCCCRRKQIVPIKVAQDSKRNPSAVAVTSVDQAKKEGKKKKKQAVGKREEVTTLSSVVTTVAANQLRVSGETVLDNQANPGNTAPDNAPAIDNGPAVVVPANGNVIDSEEGKEEKVSSPPSSPIRRPQSENRTTSQVSTQTTPSISKSRSFELPHRELDSGDGVNVVRQGILRTTLGNGTSSAVFDVDTVKETHPDYGSFEGKLKDGVYEGTRKFKNGTVQTGIFHKSKSGEYLLNDPNGRAVLAPFNFNQPLSHKIVEVRETQTGHFVGGKLNGKGERIRTTTELVDNLPQGKVTTMTIKGTFVNSALHGPDGMVIDSDGNESGGNFENNKLNGSSRYNYRISSGYGIMEGHFVDHQLQGKGRKTLLNDEVFIGTFVQNQLTDPNGKKILPNGDILEGPFVRDCLNDKGKKTLVNGDILEGVFVNGKLNGLVTITRIVDGRKIVEEKLYENDEPKESGPIAVSFSSSRPITEENKQGIQPPVASTVQTELRIFGAPAKTSSTIAPAKGPIKFSSGTVASTTSSTTTSATIVPAKGPLRFPSLSNVNVNTQEQQGQ